MKHLLILLLFQNFRLLLSNDFNVTEILAMTLPDLNFPDEIDDDQIEPHILHGATPYVFDEIRKLAKNISRSKGIYREEGDLRRSVRNKAIVFFGTESVNQILQLLDTERDKLQLLEHLEFLVHQYDVAIHFAKIKGLKYLSPLLFSSENEIVCSVASVLGAAMQSNPTVQKIAKEQNIGRQLLYLLSHRSSDVVSRILFALSAYLRHFPEAQKDFLLESGVSKFEAIFQNFFITLKAKLKIVSLISDLAIELETMDDEHEQKSTLQRLFVDEIKGFNICKYIILFLELEDYETHQKTLSAMITLQDICYNDFLQLGIIHRLDRLLIIYVMRGSLHSSVDSDLTMSLIDNINTLFAKFPNERNHTSYPNNTLRFFLMREEL